MTMLLTMREKAPLSWDSAPSTDRWWRLAEAAPEPSAPMTPAFTLAAMEHLPAGRRPVLFTAGDDSRLQALAALKPAAWRWRPVGRLASSRWGDFFFLGTPLISADRPDEALHGLLARLGEAGFAAWEVCSLPADGPVARLLRENPGLSGMPPVTLARWRRAALDATQTSDEWFGTFNSKRRRYWRSQWRQLEKRGALAFERLDASQDVTAWTEEFLRLEAAGWKGRAGTALLCDAHNAAFARAMIRAFHTHGQLRFWRLRLDGRAIASLFALVSQDTLWLGKIAYDETLRRQSPGVMLMLEVTRDILADPAIRLADSCAVPNHPMIDHLWHERLELVDMLVPLPGVSRRRFSFIAAAEGMRRTARETARRAWHRLRGTRPV